MLQRKMEPAAWEREDVAIALIEQQVSSTAPKCLLEMQRVPGVEQAAPVQGSVPKKGYTGRSSAPSSHALGEEEKKISTHRLYVSKALGRASQDRTKQEPPGRGNHL